MKSLYQIVIGVFVLLHSVKQYAQHHSKIDVAVNLESKTLNVEQEITFYNTTSDSLSFIVLNDWNNAFSNKYTPLAKRFSDEFYRGFHVAKENERGSTKITRFLDDNLNELTWERSEANPDYIILNLNKKLAPNKKINFHINYVAKIPSDKFTHFGYNLKGSMKLKDWFLTPARFENHHFTKYNNYNLDDIANANCDFELAITIPNSYKITTDLDLLSTDVKPAYSIFTLIGENRSDFTIYIDLNSDFIRFTNNDLEILSNLKNNNLNNIQKALIIDKIVDFSSEYLGVFPHKKIIVSQEDYDRNPFYGLNQLPSFISPFSEEFMFEIMFLKTYFNEYLQHTLRLDPRKDNWIYDGMHVYLMMKYIEEYHPDQKMLGKLSQLKILKHYHLANLNFNEQYSYYYMLMARKNLDQPLNFPKNSLIKFNEQIASKYRAGLSFRYLDDYLENDAIDKSFKQFYVLNSTKQTTKSDLEEILKQNTIKKLDWFFDIIIGSRDIIDYKFEHVTKTKDSVSFTIKNKTDAFVPIPVYGIKKKQLVFKNWIEPENIDTTYTFSRKEADKIVLNYDNEVPEFNLRNNWKSLKGFKVSNRPIKFNLLKDLEDPYYNQIIYVPILGYNYYDGFTPGINFHNKTILDKPFTFDLEPAYSIKAKTFSGSSVLAVNQFYRNSTLYNVRYSLAQSYYHYAPDATYLKLNPMVQMRIREKDYRDNRKQTILLRQVIVNREKSDFIADNSNNNYSVFNARYYNTKIELTSYFNFISDIQFSNDFGKFAGEIDFRRLLENNHQINLRLYAGAFLYNHSNSDYFSFAVDRPTDYLFDYGYYGRSESDGFFSQQYIQAEGGFKSKLNTPYANQWITTLNASYSIWNWIEVYGDVGVLKNKPQKAHFIYDSGIRLNLVPDYFELYFPVYSNNGWEISQQKYNEKIRFVVTFSPKTLINLFTRKWF